MADLNISGKLYESGKEVVRMKDLLDCSSYTTLSTLDSVSTGNKSISGKFSDYKVLVCATYNSSSAGWITLTIPVSVFIALYSLNSNSVWVEQNMSTTNRRVGIKYVNDTTYNITYITNATKFRMWGLKNYTG